MITLCEYKLVPWALRSVSYERCRPFGTNILLCSPVMKLIGTLKFSRFAQYASWPCASRASLARIISEMCSKNVMLPPPKKPGTACSIVGWLMFS